METDLSSRKTPLKLLIVDDHEDDAELIGLELKRSGMRLELFHTDAKGVLVEQLNKRRWDIIITDHAMPKLSSQEVIALAADTPCIVVSGAVGEETVVGLLRSGACDYVNKNNLKRLAPAIERALDETQNRRARLAAERALRRAHQDLERRVNERTADLARSNRRLKEEMEERRRAELELLEARLQLTRSRDEERSKLARDIHDGVVQDLIGLSYELADTERKIAADPTFSSLEAVRAHREAIVESVRELRSLIKGLRPPGLAEFGLENALNEFVSGLGQTGDCVIKLDIESNAKHLASDVSDCFFRVSQEAIRNVFKHASATELTVCVTVNPNNALLTVTDNGVGFTVPTRLSTLAKDNHFGLIGMDEHAHLISAQFQVSSTLSKGTTVQVTAPLKVPLALPSNKKVNQY